MANTYLENVIVLIVDDQEFIRNLVREMSRVLGCAQIYDVSNGEDAWEFVKKRPVDLAIVDWYMKPTDGIELTRRIRHEKDCPNPYLPIIMMSGFAEQARIFGARDSGINEFIVKPLSAKALFSRIQNVIEHPRQFVRTATFFGPDRRRKAQDVKDDRRGKAPPEEAPDKDMDQDDVDAFLNPETTEDSEKATAGEE